MARKQVFVRDDLRLESKDYTKKTSMGWDPDSVESHSHIGGGDELDDDGSDSDEGGLDMEESDGEGVEL